MMRNLATKRPDVHQDRPEIPRESTETPPNKAVFRIFVASPYCDASVARDFHSRARAVGVLPVSTWAENAEGCEDLTRLSRAAVRQIAHTNDLDLFSSHLLVALPREGVGAEMFAEVCLALTHRIPILWVGTVRPLSAYREGVLCVANPSQAMVYLCGFADIVGEPTEFEKRRTRAILWDFIELLHADEDKEKSELRRAG